ncbi:hypothetical protein XENOCAPTIV_022356, partial [Xenoophorus captivus]
VGSLPAGHQLAPGRAAERLNVVILQLDSLRRQPVQIRGFDLGAMVPNIPKALIIHQDEDDMRLGGRLLELISPVTQRGPPVFPRHVLDAPCRRDDEAEEESHRRPPEEHASARLGTAAEVICAHVPGETAALGDRVRNAFAQTHGPHSISLLHQRSNTSSMLSSN